MDFALLGLLLLAIALANLKATQAILEDTLSTPGQRTAQFVFVWLVPLLGAALALHSKRADAEASEGRYRGIPNAGDDMDSPTEDECIARECNPTGASGSSDGGASA